MKLKTFIVLVIICCVLSMITYFTFLHKAAKTQDQQMGKNLFDSLPVETISKITIHSSEGTVTLKKDKSLWVVEDRFGYFADFSLITDLVSKLKTSKVGRSFEASADSRSRLGLYRPDEKDIQNEQKGVRVVIKDIDNGVLVDIIFGKTREMTAGAGGHYVILARGETICLVDKKFDDLGKTPEQWIEKDLINIKAKDIEKVICYSLENQIPAYTLVRPEKEASPVLVDMPEERTLDDSKLDDVITALSPLTIEDVFGYANDPERSADINYTVPFEYHLFNGIVYRLIPGRAKNGDEKKYYIQAKVSRKPLRAEPDVDNTPSDENTPAQKENQESPAQPTARINQSIQQWIYEIPEWKFNRFIINPEDLLKKKN